MAWLIIAEDQDGAAARRQDEVLMARMREWELSLRDRILAAGSLRTDDGGTPVGSLMVLDVGTRAEAEAQSLVRGGASCRLARQGAGGDGGGMTRIVVLNGVGSVGKSSLARALQARSRLPLLHVAMNKFPEMLPAALQDHPDGISCLRTPAGVEVRVGPVGARLPDGILGAVAALAGAGCNLVFDMVMDRDAATRCRTRLAANDVVHVGLVAPLAVIEAREVLRGDRMIGLARAQFGQVHVGEGDDLTLDLDALAPETAAQVICERFGL